MNWLVDSLIQYDSRIITMGNNIRRVSEVIIVVAFVAILFSVSAAAQTEKIKVRAIKNPKPNLIEMVQYKLVKEQTLDEDIGNGEYLFRPGSLALDSFGNLYVYDALQYKIYKFNKNLELVKSFGKRGQGPGEFMGRGFSGDCLIRVGVDGKLYAHNRGAKKLVVLTLDLEFVRDVRFKDPKFLDVLNAPVVDSNGTIIIPAINNNDINLYGYGETPVVLSKITGLETAFTFLFLKPNPSIYTKNLNFLLWDTAVTKKSKVLFYLKSPSKLYVYSKDTKIKSFPILPEDALKNYEQLLREELDKLGNNPESPTYWTMFNRIFVDEENEDRFYLQYSINKDESKVSLYEFDLNGYLKNIYYFKPEKEEHGYTLFQAKKDSRFYGISFIDGEFLLTIFKKGGI